MNLESLREQWEGLPEWQKILFIGLLTVLIMYGIYTLVIEPKQLEKERLTTEVKNLQAQVDRLKRFARPEIRKKLEDKLAAIKAEIADLNKQLEEIKSIVPTEEKTQDILRFIADSAIKSNVALNTFKVSPPEQIYMRYNRSKDRLEVVTDKQKKDKSFIKINRIKINLDMSSRNVGELVAFLKRLGKSDRFFRMDKLSIEKIKPKGKQPGVFNIKITISTYFM
ncbi:type 4a pilus biogenesis protein PilO [Persephonella sp.]